MTFPDPTTLTNEKIRERIADLYPSTQQAGCSRATMLEFQALEDEEDRRRPASEGRDVIVCGYDDDLLTAELEGHEEQP